MEEKKKIYFASDAHLGSDLFGDPLEREKKLVRWMDSIKSTAKAVYFVGDMFDYWFEYRDVVPKGYVRFISKMAEFVDEGIQVYLFVGNHDIWMFDYFQKEVGAVVIDGVHEVDLYGKKFLISHGDGLGDPSRAFRLLRAIFRNKICQALYKSLHPRLTMPFGYAWSRNSRAKKLAKKMENDGESRYLGEDKEHLVIFAKEYIKTNDVDFFIFGHRHIELNLMITAKSRVVILGEWLTQFTYGVWDGENFILENYTEE